MYKENNLWGSVTVTMKRSFPETFTFAASETAPPPEGEAPAGEPANTERNKCRARYVEENKAEPFALLVRAKTSRKSSSTIVNENIPEFYKEMKEIMQQCMTFKNLKNKRNQKAAEKAKEERRQTDAPMQPTKNRKERRKEMKKQRKKQLRKQNKEKQLLEAQSLMMS